MELTHHTDFGTAEILIFRYATVISSIIISIAILQLIRQVQTFDYIVKFGGGNVIHLLLANIADTDCNRLYTRIHRIHNDISHRNLHNNSFFKEQIPQFHHKTIQPYDTSGKINK